MFYLLFNCTLLSLPHILCTYLFSCCFTVLACYRDYLLEALLIHVGYWSNYNYDGFVYDISTNSLVLMQ